MHLSGVVGGASLGPALLAYAGRSTLPKAATLVLWHAAGAGLLVALAASSHLARHTTGMLGKTPHGSLKPLNLALFWPYHAALRTKLGLQRQLSSEPIWNRVTADYYIGAWPSEEALVPAAQLAVLDVTCELPLQVAAPAYLALPTWDTHCPTVEQIEAGVAWSERQVAAGRGVLVHCAHGHGRSAAMLAAILIARGDAADVAGAVAMLVAARPRVRLNARQQAGLAAWLAARKGRQ
ncbi:Uncharacterized protein YnbD [Auxenochlorella protothecoides]|uniref:Uncharacterized protein YnbD n=2 Tax=Auxenochlorella protothecoides TaxID=3075 RepID=A0A087SDM3_AUXPR|nr:Uncharacterized protein YnbD [Auxenochlorella protothecoides]KFM23827.1 Uncharacterized protein YnbD [Auxenochlorella protothecoides]RMZ54835.1 hypothetical protein APUTEX25_000352 [Auxenochlorella protothecoides]|eukprot:RMZ54835.1 hypothetical protein APUTEX25_000352 [Auxenochlorella protothecoides]